jgi:hypothetical protein
VFSSWYAQAADWCTQPELNLNGLSKHFDEANRPPSDERNAFVLANLGFKF